MDNWFYMVLTPEEFGSAAIIFPVLGIALVGLRFYSKLSRKLECGIEDWLVIPTLAFVIAINVFTLYGIVEKAMGYLSDGNTDPRIKTARLVYWNAEWLQCLALGCMKLSFLFFYRRIFCVDNHPRKAFGFAVNTMIGISIVWMLGFFLGAMLTCPGNVSAYWEHLNRSSACFNTIPYLYALTWSDACTDLVIILLPIPMLLRLHMTLKKRLAVIGIFLLGALTVGVSVTRAILYIGVLRNESGIGIPPAWENTMMQLANGVYWIQLETGIALIAVNLPIIYGVTRSAGVQAIVKRMRSIVSLSYDTSSQRSQSSRGTLGKAKRTNGMGGSDVEMQAGLVGSGSRPSRKGSEDTCVTDKNEVIVMKKEWIVTHQTP